MQISLNIGLIGYGKMGKMVESIALERGHQISFVARSASDEWKEADVLIEFSRPESAINNIRKALSHSLPLVIGTTGWHEQLQEITKEVKTSNGALLHASNFSLGVNMCFAINEKLAQLMNNHPDYTASIEETHHTEKLDSPSGTAISFAQGVIDQHSEYTSWKEKESGSAPLLPIQAYREPDVPGTHIVRWQNDIDQIELKHQAKSRKGFALGAVIAAEWLHGRKGIFTMKNVLEPIPNTHS